MMITIRNLIFTAMTAVLIVLCAEATEELNAGSIRGSSASHRSLQDVDGSSNGSGMMMNDIMMNGMTCTPVPGPMGSVSCTFNTVANSDVSFERCMNSTALGGQFCIAFLPTAGIVVQPSPPLPDAVLPPPPPPLPPPIAGSSSLYPIGSHTGYSVYDMKCPRSQPQSGSSCGAWLPTGVLAGKCQYGPAAGSTCECAKKNNLSTTTNPSDVCWNCGDGIQCLKSVDAVLSSFEPPPTAVAPPVPNRVVVIPIADPIRGDWCPPPEQMPITGGLGCQELRRCAYLDSYDPMIRATKVIDCKCDTNIPNNDGDHRYVCQDGVPDLYGLSF